MSHARLVTTVYESTLLTRRFEGLTREPDFFGAPRYSFSSSDHLGTRAARVDQIRNGRWEKVTDYFQK